MMFLLMLIYIVAFGLLLIISCKFIGCMVNLIFKKNHFSLENVLFCPDGKDHLLIVSIVLAATILVALLISPRIHDIIGIHSLTEKTEGTYCFYVQAQNEAGEQFIVPAEIKKEVASDIAPVGDGEKVKNTSYYHIKKLFFDNGEVVEFQEDSKCRTNSIKDNYEEATKAHGERFFDLGWNEWNCVIINKHAYSPCVSETTSATVSNIIWIVAGFLAIMFEWIGLIYLRIKEQKQRSKS